MIRLRAIVCLALVLGLWPAVADAAPIRLWHSYRGAEAEALAQIVSAWEKAGGEKVDLLSVPHDAFAAKLTAAIPLGDGPDAFIDAHERLGSYLERKLVAPVGDGIADPAAFAPPVLSAMEVGGERYGVPLSQKCVALYYRTDLVSQPASSFDELRRSVTGELPSDGYVLAYESNVIYHHAPFLHAFGGRLLNDDDSFGFVGPGAVASLVFVKELADDELVPRAADGAMVTRLFGSGKAAYAISGPWLATSLPDSVPYGVAPLPIVAETGKPLMPLLTVEALMMSPDGVRRDAVRAFARVLANRDAAEIRMAVARTVSARRDARPPEDNRFLAVFAEQAENAVPMPTSVAMRAVWEPAEKALRKVMHGGMDADEALAEAKFRFDDVRRPLPEPDSPALALLLLGAVCLLGAFTLVQRARDPSFRSALRHSLPAYKWLTHAVVSLGLLVFLPLCAGAAISLFAGPPGDQYYVGVDNFIEILTARGGPLLASGSFYLVLLVTLLWTVLNVTLHLAIGVTLGVFLSRPTMKLRAVYRVLLILPWAVPNYVTALAWKGMFDRQFGAVRGLTDAIGGVLGVDIQAIDWFARFSTAFSANLATNVWLGFPFMMVIAIAALTGVPRDVLEAAEVDGASRWERFWQVTLPIVRPAMLPAVVLGSIWTFNMFNVVFLVSGGDPDGTTDILVSEAYRWAFTREAQYGYAAAYAVLIFLLLFGATRLLDRLRGGRPQGGDA